MQIKIIEKIKKFIEKHYTEVIIFLFIGYFVLFSICIYKGEEMESEGGKLYINFVFLVLNIISDTCATGNIITPIKKTKKMRKSLKCFLDQARNSGYGQLTKGNIVKIIKSDHLAKPDIEKLRWTCIGVKIIICAILTYILNKMGKIVDYKSFFINVYTCVIFLEIFIQEFFDYKYNKLLNSILENKFNK